MSQQHPKFINPFTDFGFKKIFGEEANKDLLIDFLNELLRSQNIEIKDLTYKKTEKLGISPLDRNVVFDLLCENEKGEKFTVELQKAKQAFFKDRMLYYSSFSIQEQGIKGDWNYELKAVFVIAIMDFFMDDEQQKSKNVIGYNKLMNIETKEIFYHKLCFITLEMPYFTKELDELETNFDKWLYVIKNLHKLESIPERIQNKIFEKLFKVALYSALSKEEREKYEESLKYYNDLKNSLDTAFEDGKKEALKEIMPVLQQREEELEQERQRAEQERQRAEQERKEKEQERLRAEQERLRAEQERKEKEELIIKSVLKLFEKGFTIEEIAETLCVRVEDVNKILQDNKKL